eukprot:GFYU01056485.1.p1 GENE.GFYU01056485.1~~GFYU01056485.1.p1  ORF type:complete len:129 (-),score=12.62 GFYU01056485.1:35-367(-)
MESQAEVFGARVFQILEHLSRAKQWDAFRATLDAVSEFNKSLPDSQSGNQEAHWGVQGRTIYTLCDEKLGEQYARNVQSSTYFVQDPTLLRKICRRVPAELVRPHCQRSK